MPSCYHTDNGAKFLNARLEFEAKMLTYYLKLYFCTLLAFFAIDMVWLGLIARGFYQKQLGYLLRPDPNWTAALVFYLLFVFGLLVFVVVPGLQAGSTKKVLILGALFGIITYATYDLTNLATVKDWPLAVTVVDLLWGGILATAVSYLGFLAGKWLQ
ncbi:MAG: DUF2177 family protein [Pirellulaceae bacterium]|nr:DUF2177 family protein [Pirellulaceae bacterium]MCU0979208.1 DUF2177 family protein [Pirellulaceae bacterium]